MPGYRPLFAVILMTAAGAASNSVSTVAAGAPERIRELVDHAWEEPPRSLDMTFMRKKRVRPRSDDEVIRNLQETYEPQRKQFLDPNEFQKFFERELERTLRAQREPRIRKQRVRAQGEFYRLDDVLQWHEPIDESTEFNVSYIHSGFMESGVYENIVYNYGAKSATRYLDSRKPMWYQEQLWKIGSIGQTPIIQIRAATGDVQGDEVIRNDRKVDELCRGENPRLKIDVDQTTLKGTRVYRFRLYETSSIPLLFSATLLSAVFVAVDPPWRVLQSDVFHPRSGELMFRATASQFDEEGFPWFYREDKYHDDGFHEWDEFEILAVDRETVIPQEVFEYHVPEGFMVKGDVYEDKMIFTELFERGKKNQVIPVPPRPAPPAMTGRSVMFYGNLIFVTVCLSVMLYQRMMSRKRVRNS